MRAGATILGYVMLAVLCAHLMADGAQPSLGRAVWLLVAAAMTMLNQRRHA